MARSGSTSYAGISGISLPTTCPHLDQNVKRRIVCMHQLQHFNGLHISACPHVVPKRLLQYWQEYVLPWRKTRDKVLFKLYQSQSISQAQQKGKKKENNIQKYTTHISPKICHCPGTEVFIFLKAPSHKERTDTMWGRPSHPAPGAAPQGAIGINIQKPVMGGAGSPRAE